MKTLLNRSVWGSALTLGALSLGALASGCTESAIDDARVSDQTLTVGAASLSVPAGAAPAGFSPTIEAVADAPEWAPSIIPGTLHRFGPHGTEFDKPVSLTLTYDPAQLGDVKPSNLRVVFLDESGEQLQMMGATVDVAAQTVTGETTHFSMFAAAPECAAHADCAAGEACVAGGCEAEGAACAANADCARGEVCLDGVCDGGGPEPEPQPEPQPEVCGDGIDNDHDGVVDEDCAGECAQNADCGPAQRCVDGVCEGGEPEPEPMPEPMPEPEPQREICGDGIDNDMDGLVDEDCGGPACDDDRDCGPGQACIAGVCEGGEPEPEPQPEPEPEICGDGIDNDFDGLVDEDCGGEICGDDSDCAPGEACIDGVCDGVIPPDGEELCDGIDNNGNGVVDEGCAPAACGDDAQCPEGQVCVDGVCGDGVADELCDGVDNDTDGEVDEGCGLACFADADCGPGQVCARGECSAP